MGSKNFSGASQSQGQVSSFRQKAVSSIKDARMAIYGNNINGSFDIDPYMMESLGATSAQSETTLSDICNHLSELQQQLSDTAALAIIYCSDTASSTNDLDHNAKVADFILTQSMLSKRQQTLLEMSKKAYESISMIQEACRIIQNASKYLSETAADFIGAEKSNAFSMQTWAVNFK